MLIAVLRVLGLAFFGALLFAVYILLIALIVWGGGVVAGP